MRAEQGTEIERKGQGPSERQLLAQQLWAPGPVGAGLGLGQPGRVRKEPWALQQKAH